MPTDISVRHVHHNVVTGLLVVGYVLVIGSALKWAVNRWSIPGLTQLVNYVL